jgi:hypothetical protein
LRDLPPAIVGHRIVNKVGYLKDIALDLKRVCRAAKMEFNLTPMTRGRTTGKRQSFAMRLLAVLVSIFFVAASTQAAEQAPEDAVRVFYAWALAHPSRALPSPKERAQLANVLSPDSIQLLKSASDTEAKCIKAAPKGEKPLIIEGDLFVGNYEGATEVAYRDLLRKGDSVVVESDLLYVDTRFPKAHKHRAVAWRDRLELRLVGNRWYVQDVQFPKNPSLVAALTAYIEDGARSCVNP